VESGERVVVGVNRFASEEEPAIEVLRIDPKLEREQVARLGALRARRDAPAWSAALDRLEQAARSRDNLLPPIIEAVLAWATVGEITGRLRTVFGEHRETLVL
jgi:methylmalonyl-CoA mutase N-terminal domain/subunit